ncbi:hypothetical protein MJO28_016925, partial [Puccinia striiformis f. sp. tritici]
MQTPTLISTIDNGWLTKQKKMCLMLKTIHHHLASKMIPCKHHGYLLAWPIATLLRKKNLFHKISAALILGLTAVQWPVQRTSCSTTLLMDMLNEQCSDHGNADDKTSNCGEEAKPATRTFPPTPH